MIKECHFRGKNAAGGRAKDVGECIWIKEGHFLGKIAAGGRAKDVGRLFLTFFFEEKPCGSAKDVGRLFLTNKQFLRGKKAPAGAPKTSASGGNLYYTLYYTLYYILPYIIPYIIFHFPAFPTPLVQNAYSAAPLARLPLPADPAREPGAGDIGTPGHHSAPVWG